jgi:hypothetical protein
VAELEWSSGGHKGTMEINDHGKPFRTSSAATGSTLYGYPIGRNVWVEQPRG